MGSKKLFTLLAAVVGWVALILQFVLLLQNRVTSVPEAIIRFFSFFTILTNILVTVFFTAETFSDKPKSLGWRSFAGATAILIYILVVGIVYNLVLRQLWAPTGWQRLADELLHVVTPLLMLCYWLIFSRKQSLSWSNLWHWLAYPAIYLVFILLRGAPSGFYPYPFMDVSQLGLSKVLMNAGMVLLLFLCLGIIFIGSSRKFFVPRNHSTI